MTLPMVRIVARLRRFLGAGLIFVLLIGCASMSSTPLHSFAFDAMKDSPDILILAFKYGEARASAVHDDEAEAARRGVPNARQFTGIGGYISRGDFLYVKWRIKRTASAARSQRLRDVIAALTR